VAAQNHSPGHIEEDGREDRAAQFLIEGEADPAGRQSVVVAEGASLPLRIDVEGRDPGEVEVVQSPKRGRFLLSAAKRRTDGEYRCLVRDIRVPMTLRARGGDDDGRGREVDVTVIPLPMVGATRVTYRYPEYLEKEDETRESAEVEAPEGTLVDMVFTLSCPAARAVLRKNLGGEEASVDLAADMENPLILRHSMEVRASGHYRVELWNDRGFGDLDNPVYPVICRKDQDPRIKLLRPRRRELDVTPEAVIPFRATAEDDHGVARMGIAYRVVGPGKEEVLDFTARDVEEPFGSKRLVGRHVMDLELRRFPFVERTASTGVDPKDGDAAKEGDAAVDYHRLSPRDSLIYSLFAIDSRPGDEGGKVLTESAVINVVTGSEKIRLLTERQIRLREDVRNLLAYQQEKRERVREVMSDAEEEGGLPGEQALLSLEIGQNQITMRGKRVAREFAVLFDEYLFNRLDKTSGAAALLERALSIESTSLADGAGPGGDVFDPAHYAALVTASAGGEFGEMDAMSRLLGMLGLSLVVSSDLSPRAAGSLSRAVVCSSEEEKPALIRDALETQSKIIKALELLLEKMSEWEDFQELLQMMRDIVDDQERLNTRTREWIKK